MVSKSMIFGINCNPDSTPGADTVLLDFEEVEFIASAGLRAVLSTAKELKEKGTKMEVCSLSESVGKIFEVSGLKDIISIRRSDVKDEDFKNLKTAYDVDIIADNVRDIVALTLEKHEYVNDCSLSESVRERARKQMEEAMLKRIEEIKRQRPKLIKEMYALASRALEDTVGNTDA